MLPDPVWRQSFERRLGQTHLLMLESLQKKQDETENPLGTQILAEAIFGSLFYHEDTGAGKCHSGVSTEVLPTHQLVSSSPETSQAKQPVM